MSSLCPVSVETGSERSLLHTNTGRCEPIPIPAPAIKLPSRLIVTEYIGCAGPVSFRTSLPEARSISRTLLSATAATTHLPSGEIVTAFTATGSVTSTFTKTFFSTSQVRIVLSDDTETSVLPSGVNATP